MVNKLKVIPLGDFMALLEAARHHADVFEALLLELLNEELQNALMISPDVQETLILHRALLSGLRCLEFALRAKLIREGV